MRALEHLKILDFSTLLPGPYATMLLADLGAEVVRVSAKTRYDLVTHWPPVIEGTNTTAAAAWLGRNKKTIELDLKRPLAVEAVKKLIGEYDILVEQFRPGVMERLGLGYEALAAINPRLIYCSLTGYGQTGPLAERAGHDINYLARSGNMAAAGRRQTGPVLTNMQVADVAAGSMNTVVGILAAVESRHYTGIGQRVDIAMLDGVIPFLGMDGAGFLVDGHAPKREGQLLNGGTVYDFYETADGAYMSVGSLEPKFLKALCEGCGLSDWLAEGRQAAEPAAFKKELKRVFLQKPRAEWQHIFEKLDACVEPVLTAEEILCDEQIAARDMLPSVPLPSCPGDTVRQLGCPIKLSATPPDYRHAGWPDGSHTDEVLSAFGYSAQEIAQMNG